MSAGGISIHAVDVAEGRIADGLWVAVRRLEPEPVTLAVGRIGSNGLFDHPIATGEGVIAGIYEVEFKIEDYLRGQGRAAPFLDVTTFRFALQDVRQHCHLPFKFTPFGYSLFRGA